MSKLHDEIWEQPEALHRTLDEIGPALDELKPIAARLRNGNVERVILTGMGSSLNATYPAMTFMAEHGITAISLDASELLHYHFPLADEKSALVAVSQSGRSVEICALAERLTGKIPLIGITNEPESPLAKSSDIVIGIQAGEEETVSSKTYTCTVATLNLAARVLSNVPTEPAFSSLRRAADVIADGLTEWSDAMPNVIEHVIGCRYLIFLGRGPSYASAMTGALVVKETAKLPAEGMSGGLFRHGPLELTSGDLGVFTFAGRGRTRELNLRLAHDIVALGGQVVTLGNSDRPVDGALTLDVPLDDEWALPVAEIVPIHIFAADLAARLGLEVGKFRYIQKVTTVE